MEPLPAGRDASSGVGVPPYVRHRPGRTLLYQLAAEYYPAFKAHLAAQGNALPGYVEQEFEDYLKCGRLDHGLIPGILPHSRAPARSHTGGSFAAGEAMRPSPLPEPRVCLAV